MKSIFKKIFFIITIFIFAISLILTVAGAVLFYNASKTDLTLKQGYNPIKIYDDNNNLITTDSIYYNYTSIYDVSDYIKNAFIAVEDRDFYNHNGFSVKRIFKAMINNIANKNFTQGASTITQQYIKNVYLTNEKTISRKINEIALAIELEKRYTKDQILEAYLNSILFGGNIYGIDMACRYYFNKSPKDIGISEACYLAGMIQAPNYYNAYKNLAEADIRKNVVLKCMLEEGYISDVEYLQQKDISLKSLLADKSITVNQNYLASYLDYIYDIADTSYDICEIYTYLDTDIQKELYKIINNSYGLFNDDNLNCAIVVLDNNTYGVKALVGNRNTNQKVINYAYDVKLQPGSTIKPILDYAPAIEYFSYSPATIIVDELYYYHDGMQIHNYDHQYLGPITLRKALSDSRNVPAVKLFNEVGYERAFEFAKKIGIDSSEIYESDAIGGAKNGYSLLDLGNAYQAFANLGYYKKASGIKSLHYFSHTINNDEKPKLQMKPTTAWLINNMLHDVFKGSSYDLADTYLMAKTGQTNYDAATLEKYNIPYGATKDSLLVAYTKDITIAVWVGYNYITSENYLDRYKKNIPRNIMRILMTKFSEPGGYYDEIEGITKSYITIYDNTCYLAKDNGYYEYFITGTEPLSYPNFQESI